jgi:hypothetical protein
MASTNLAVRNEDATALTAEFETPHQQMKNAASQLRTIAQKEKPTHLDVALAHEYAVEANRYLKAISQSKLVERIKSAFDVHRYLTDIRNGFDRPAKATKQLAQQIESRYATNQLIEAERLKHEQEQARTKEAEALAAQGRTEEAQLVAERPIFEPEQRKAEGVIEVETWVVEEIKDHAALLTWLVENPSFRHWIMFDMTAMKKDATANRGTLQIPGVKFVRRIETRNRG